MDIRDSYRALTKGEKKRLSDILRCCFAAEIKHTNTLAGREVNSARNLSLEPFAKFLRVCCSQSLNPFHAMRCEFNKLNIGDSPPSVNDLYNPGMRPEYRKVTNAWNDELPRRLQYEWNAAYFCVSEVSDMLGCERNQASQIALADGRLPIVFAHAMFHTFDLPLPKGSFGEALKAYAQSPAAYAKAASSVGLELPRSLTKHGPLIKKVG